jgi:hypothetical protein
MLIVEAIRKPRILARALATTTSKWRGQSDGRWRDDQLLDAEWDTRTKLMVRDIAAGSRVIDVGAGRQVARAMLPSGSEYVPMDIVSRSPDTIVCDLNRDKLPDLHADWVIASGVIEYVHDAAEFINWMSVVAPRIVMSYEVADGETKYYRRSQTWVNDFTSKQVLAILRQQGLIVDDIATWRRQKIYWLTAPE